MRVRVRVLLADDPLCFRDRVVDELLLQQRLGEHYPRAGIARVALKPLARDALGFVILTAGESVARFAEGATRDRAHVALAAAICHAIHFLLLILPPRRT